MRGFVRRRSRQPVARVKALPPPYGGLNTRDLLIDAPQVYSVVAENIIPDRGAVRLREGYETYVSGLVGPVETLMTFDDGSTKKQLAAANGKIRDITGGALVETPLASSLISNRWQSAHFTDGAGGTKLLMVNGNDGIKSFDGTTISTVVTSGSPTPPSNFSDLASHQSFLWFIEPDSLNAWHFDTAEASSGAMSRFPLASLPDRGGKLIAVETWTHDGGDGSDDLLCFVTDQGEVLVYEGTNPTSASTWRLFGRYRVASPLGGARCTQRVGGDLQILTETGIRSMREVVEGNEDTTNVSDAIAPTFETAALNFRNVFGWQLVYAPQREFIFANQPAAGVTIYQHYRNLRTGGWATLSGMDARCWMVDGRDLYFGDNAGRVFKAFVDDLYTDNGGALNGYLRLAPSNYGSASIKTWSLARLHITADTQIAPAVVMRSEFNDPRRASPVEYAERDYADWGDPWGTSWSGRRRQFTRTVPLHGESVHGSLDIAVSSLGSPWALNALEVTFIPGREL